MKNFYLFLSGLFIGAGIVMIFTYFHHETFYSGQYEIIYDLAIFPRS